MSKTYTYLEAIEHFGSPSEMARRLGIKPQAVYQWDGKIPDLRQFQIQQVIAADLSGRQLRSETDHACQ